MAIIFLTLNNSVMAQAKMNGRTKSFIKLSKKMERRLAEVEKTAAKMNSITPLKKSKETSFLVSGFIKVDAHILKEKDLKKLNIKIGTKTDVLWTFRAPYDSILSLSKIDGVLYMEMDKKVKL